MPSYFIPLKNAEYIIFTSLVDSTARPDFKSSPTLAAGDFKVSTDGGALANLATLPTVTPAASVMVKITLSASEMNGDNVTMVAIDAAGSEWDDLVINVHTSEDIYQSKTILIDDDTGTTDRYTSVWFKNGEPVTSGITSPTIQVIKVSDGLDLVASVAMTEIASLGMFRYTEGTNRVVSGDDYIVKTQATIGGATRTWFQQVGRDD